MDMEWTQVASIVASVMAGIATCIPLAVKLVEYVQKAIQEKNWPDLLSLVMKYMAEAEEKFETGAERKEWVLVMIKASAETVNYEIDLDVVGKMIDDLCGLTNVVNAPATLPETTEN